MGRQIQSEMNRYNSLAETINKRYLAHVNSEIHASDLIDGLAGRGVYSLTSQEARAVLGGTPKAVALALNRLKKQGFIASPAKSFYVIVPPEYRAVGCLPAEQFVPDLMKRLRLPYYVGLLSAAQYFGAAHQRPQAFQILLEKNRRPIRCGRVRVVFTARRRLAEVPVQDFNTPRGTVTVSSPEATALDLVGYADSVGGLTQVALVLAELAERIDAEKLAGAARTAPVPWAQRLGYLLERGGFVAKAAALKAYVHEHARQSTALAPAPAPVARLTAHHDEGWKLYVNKDVEVSP
jgi:predicted transcriptional regulator of viral defense system